MYEIKMFEGIASTPPIISEIILLFSVMNNLFSYGKLL